VELVVDKPVARWLVDEEMTERARENKIGRKKMREEMIYRRWKMNIFSLLVSNLGS